MNPDDKARLKNLRRRVNRIRNFPNNTCGASRHLHMIAEQLATGKPYPMLQEEPEHCAETMLSVLEALAIYGTGNQMPDDLDRYVATFQMLQGTLVFHVFEIEG